MADETIDNTDINEDFQEDSVETNDSYTAGRGATIKMLLNSKVVIVLVILTVIINGVGLAFHSVGRGNKTNICAEHDLGDYQFLAGPSEKGQISAAEFRLHIALLDEVEEEAFCRLSDRKYRVQQDIEELLRQAHGGDFNDPTLGELKRRIQARINETLEMRVIADVIITDLKLTGERVEGKPNAETAVSIPWVENSSP